MASGKKKSPDFFEDHWVDPVAAATRTQAAKAATRKRKVGFYISEDLLNRFNRKFHELKLSAIPVDNKSSPNGSNSEPLDVKPQNLRLSKVQRDAGWSGSVHRIDIPTRLGHRSVCNDSSYQAAFNQRDSLGSIPFQVETI